MVHRAAEPLMSLTQLRSAGKPLPFLLFEGLAEKMRAKSQLEF
jgi:hypothetical protein